MADTWWLAHNARNKVFEGRLGLRPGFEPKHCRIPSPDQRTGSESVSRANGRWRTWWRASAKEGDAEAAFKTPRKSSKQNTAFPLLSHAPLEPQNSTAWFKDGKIKSGRPARSLVPMPRRSGRQFRITDVTFHLVRAGGGFGRRLVNEYDIEVSKIARLVADERTKAGQPSVPVKLLWSREDDMHHDDYRPPGYHYFKAGLDASRQTDRLPRLRCQLRTTFSRSGKRIPARLRREFLGLRRPLLAFQHPDGRLARARTNGISFVMQSFIDEVAYAAGKDPLQFRLDLLEKPDSRSRRQSGRQRRPFNAARRQAAWWKP